MSALMLHVHILSVDSRVHNPPPPPKTPATRFPLMETNVLFTGITSPYSIEDRLFGDLTGATCLPGLDVE